MKKTEDRELLWKWFHDTGDPLCWLEYRRRAAEERDRGKTPS